MGILRIEEAAGCGELTAEDSDDPLDIAVRPAAFAEQGIAAASKLPLVLARNCRRSIPSDLAFVCIRLPLMTLASAAQFGGIIRRFA
jgi:hypothetical protein